jgi:hypothetical protein
MMAEIFPQIYDATGKQVSQPFHGRKVPHPMFPMGRYSVRATHSGIMRTRIRDRSRRFVL